MKKILLWAICLSAGLSVFGYTPVLGESQSTEIVPGEWNARHAECRAYSEANNIPIVVFWAASGCTQCEKLEAAVKNQDFIEWMKSRGLVMNFVMGNNPYRPATAKTFAKSGIDYHTGEKRSIGEYPFIAVQYMNADGEFVKYNFSGRSGSMPVTSGSLQKQFMDSVDLILKDWKPQVSYSGGNFHAPGTNEAHRLEAVIGKTKMVSVPLIRTVNSDSAATNTLEAVYRDSVNESLTINWAVGETNKMVLVSTDFSDAQPFSALELELYDETRTNKVETGRIVFVEEPANSPANPKWLGEDFETGEWTMDLDKALEKALDDPESRTLVLATGGLWCPYCKSLESKVLSSDKFKEWSVSNKINLVLLDNPKRSSDDVRDAKGVVLSVGMKADGAPPSLLRYAADAKGVSGAAYISRNMIEIGDSSEDGTAEWVLQRNHDLLYQGGSLCAPEELRTGYPTLILVNPDGTAAGRLLSGVDGPNFSWGISVDETINRLDELLLLYGEDEKSSAPSTTELSLSVAGPGASGSLQVNDSEVFYRLENVPDAEIVFNVSDPGLVLTVYETDSVLTSAKVLKAAKGSININLSSSTNKFISVSMDISDNLAVYGVGTTKKFELTSSCVLKPAESMSEYTPYASNVVMSLVGGVKYRFSGFADSLSGIEGLDPLGDDIYRVSSDGLYELPVISEQKISFQIWNPGSIAFNELSYRFLESSVTGTIRVVRSGGSSGVSKVKVSIADSGTLAENRYEWSDVTLNWEDGESGEKIVPFVMNVDNVYDEESYLILALNEMEFCAALVSTNNAVVTVFDSDDPCFAKSMYEVSAYNGFSSETLFETANIDVSGRVQLKRTSGRLPSGVSVKYDRETQQVVMSGVPKTPGEYLVTYTIKQNGETGVSTAIKIIVEDPSLYNSYVNTKHDERDVMLYAELDDGDIVLAGKVTVSISNRNRITAKYTGTAKKTVSFNGQWSALDKETGLMSATLKTRAGAELEMELTEDGLLRIVRLAGVENDFGDEFFGECSLTQGAFERYAGYYTVTLPTCVAEGEIKESSGTGYLTLEMTNAKDIEKGAVKYKGMLGNGATISGTAYLFNDPENDGHALLPIFVRSSKEMFSAVLDMQADASEIGHDVMGLQTVFRANGVAAVHRHIEDGFSYEVEHEIFGSYYTPNTNLEEWCELFSLSASNMVFAIDGAQVSSSNSVYGVADFGEVVVLEADGTKFTIKNSVKTVLKKLTLARKTGIFSGSAKVSFSNGKTASATIKGVLMPGWIAGCSDCSDAISRPFASGTIYYSDRIHVISNGRTRNLTIKRGAAVDIEAEAIVLEDGE